MCPAAAAGYNACPGSNPLTITCPGGELIRSPKTLTLILLWKNNVLTKTEMSKKVEKCDLAIERVKINFEKHFIKFEILKFNVFGFPHLKNI